MQRLAGEMMGCAHVNAEENPAGKRHGMTLAQIYVYC